MTTWMQLSVVLLNKQNLTARSQADDLATCRGRPFPADMLNSLLPRPGLPSGPAPGRPTGLGISPAAGRGPAMPRAPLAPADAGPVFAGLARSLAGRGAGTHIVPGGTGLPVDVMDQSRDPRHVTFPSPPRRAADPKAAKAFGRTSVAVPGAVPREPVGIPSAAPGPK
jgi:hypothetical protein